MTRAAATGRIEVVPASPERWDDVVAVVGGSSDRGCWCQAPRGLDTGPARHAPGGRRALLRAQLESDPPAGMLAYLDGEVAGWLGFGPRSSLPRLEHSRTIPKIDDQRVWSIVCFNIRVGYRRQGIASALLDGVVDYARRSGAPGVEAYPVDPGGGRVDTAFAFVGLTPMFERAGFERIVETAGRSAGRPRILMRRMLETPGPDPAGAARDREVP